MGLPLSMDLRTRVLAVVDAGMSCRSAAARFGVAPSMAIRWEAQRRATGSFEPKPQGGDTRSARIEEYQDAILALWEARRDITLDELRLELAKFGLVVANATLHRFFVRHGMTRKNVWSTPSARVMLDDVLVCINVSGLRAPALAKMDHARLGLHKDGGVEHHIFDQALATRGQPLRHLSFTSTDIVSGVGAVPAAIPRQPATTT